MDRTDRSELDWAALSDDELLEHVLQLMDHDPLHPRVAALLAAVRAGTDSTSQPRRGYAKGDHAVPHPRNYRYAAEPLDTYVSGNGGEAPAT
ncbi:hypothetical protein GCM10022402_42140 [Salinactinospora qingdaonensis]|uniref:Uncharacterized protein n=1 Tax=Salinactinospora qingdaonensis TaxID=702744 RepID=A0ABP7GBR2_9ACTN